MSDNVVPPSHDNDEQNLGAFSDFVNDHLDLSDLENSNALLPPFVPLRPSKPRPFPSSIDYNDEDDDDLEEDDDTERVDPSPFHSLLPTHPFSRNPASPRSSPSTGSSFGGTSPLLPRPSDSRWVKGMFQVTDDLEIYHSMSPFSNRVTLFPNASRRWDKRIVYIRDIAPGWSVVNYRYTSSRALIGYVKNSSVKLIQTRPVQHMTDGFLGMKIGLVDMLIIAVLLYVMGGMLMRTGVFAPTADRLAAFDANAASIAATMEGQSQRIATLEASIEAQ